MVHQIDAYDYTVKQDKHDNYWYLHAVETKQPFWLEPKFGNTAKQFTAGYAVPFFTSADKKTVAGVITLHYTIDELRSLMRGRFNIEMSRIFIDPFVSIIAPIIMIFLILFIVMLASSAHPEKSERFGFNALAAFGILTGLLFLVAVWHSGLRTMLASSDISYAETFYIISYVLIGFVGVNSLLLSTDNKIAFIKYQDNLLPKMLFLPFTAALCYLTVLIKLF